MARVEVTRTSPIGPYPGSVSADDLDVAFTAAEADGTPDNENYFTVAGGKQLLLVRNVHATTTYTFTLNSAADDFGREEDVTDYSLAAGEQAVFLIKSPGWVQSGNQIHLEANNLAIEFAVIDLD